MFRLEQEKWRRQKATMVSCFRKLGSEDIVSMTED